MKITTASELDVAILELEERRKTQEQDLIEHFNITYESLKPMNLLKGAIADITGSEEIRDKVINAAVGVGTGLLTRKILMGKSPSLFRKIIGGAAEFGIANFVGSHMDNIKEFVSSTFDKFFHKKEENNDN
jgi:hypothetical protein